jgi:transposase
MSAGKTGPLLLFLVDIPRNERRPEMETAATQAGVDSKQPPILYMAFELGRKKWKLGFTVGLGQKARRRTIAGGDMEAVLREIAAGRRRFGVSEEARVVSCYEAGPEGFWLHRWLEAQGVENVVVDSASIEVNRRKRRAKSDGLDVQALLTLLIRHTLGERRVWSVVRVPPPQIEDARQLHRELATLTEERTRIRNRVRGLLATQGLSVGGWAQLRAQLQSMRLWDGAVLGAHLCARLERALDRLEVVARQIREIQRSMHAAREAAAEAGSPGAMMQRLMEVRSIGMQGARVMVIELFGWRQFQNRRQVGGSMGLTPTPYQSGERCHEQGITKAGNKWLRRVAIQIAWNWVRWQPHSQLSKWFAARFATAGRRQRRVGIVALARKLMIALWRYASGGQPPLGAVLGQVDTYGLKAA